MAYRVLNVMNAYNVIVRWHGGYTISDISRTIGVDRKTVRRIIAFAQQSGISKDQPLPEKARLIDRLKPFGRTNQRSKPARHDFEKHKDEIIALITNKSDPLKPKTAYDVICLRYDLKASYSSFKRFMRESLATISKPPSTCRFETPAGQEIQVDYGYVGLLYNPETQKKQKIYAFIATLSFSRLKYIEFSYKQDQISFVAAHVRMLNFFGGSPKSIIIDNLKAGVIEPDLYDPKLNPAYQEFAEHYNVFIDTARVGRPKDKAKVERTVPDARELFRKLKAVHLHLDLAKANKLAQNWCLTENGMKVHGTTGLKPFEVFLEIEKAVLNPLPEQAFEIATWKQAKVHVDQFIQFEKKFYAVPQKYTGKTVWVRGSEKLVEIFHDYQLIKSFPKSSQKRLFDPADFPENVQVMLGDQAIQSLIERAGIIGPLFKKLILCVLSPHARLNFRRAQGLLHFKKQFSNESLEKAAAVAIVHKIYVPAQFKQLILKLQETEESIPISEATNEFLRSSQYFVN